MAKEIVNADLARIRIALCGQNRQVLFPVRSELMRLGYHGVQWIRSDGELRQWVQVGIPDLIVADHELDKGAAIKTITEIRNGDLGENPFVVAILTTWTHDPETVSRAINSGVDDLIVAPYSTGQLLDRIQKLINYRKPFIATSDYVGPDRRRDPDREQSRIPTFEAPNTLRIRQEGGQVDMHEMKDAISQAKVAVMEEKLRRIGFQISFLVDLILPSFHVGEFDRETNHNIQRLEIMCNEAVQRLKDTRYASVSELCRSMHKLAKKMADSPENASSDDIELLKPLSRAILEAFYPSEATNELAGQIAEAVSGYAERRSRPKKKAAKHPDATGEAPQKGGGTKTE